MDEILDPPETAAILKVRETTLADWRAQGYGPPFSRLRGPRGHVRYLRSDLVNWIRTRQQREEVAS